MEGDSRPIPDPTILTTEQLHREIGALRELVETRLDGLAALSNERLRALEQRMTSDKTTAETAVNAALAAQKEAASKSEEQTAKLLDQLRLTFTVGFDELRRGFDDLKGRVGTIESVKTGGREAYAGLYAVGILIVAALTALITYGAVHK